MPNTREKLEVIAHLGDHITYKEDIGICYDSALAKVIEDAYMTLKNGVTVQDWIPLSERKPGREELALVFFEGMRDTPAAIQVMYGWCIGGSASHWMPLPQPPKGE